MNLPLKLTSSSDCFVSLPVRFSQLLFNENSNNIVLPAPIRISWKSKDGKQQDVFVGWPGTASENNTLTIDQNFAAMLNLCEIHNGTYIPVTKTVRITVISDVPVASTVEVVPNDIDDWEILELHPEYLENEILKQIAITYVGQCFPIRIYHHTVIKLRTVNISPNAKCVRLQNNTEIIVAPKPRNVDKPQQIDTSNTTPDVDNNNNNDDDDNRDGNNEKEGKKSSKPPINVCILRIQPCINEDIQRVVYISERTCKQLNWKPQDLISIQPIAKLSTLQSENSNNKGNNVNKENSNDPNQNMNINRHPHLLSRSQHQIKEKESDQPTHFLSNIAYCSVLPRRDIEDGFVVIPSDIRKQLKIPTASRVKLSRNPIHSLVTPKSLHLHSIKWKFSLGTTLEGGEVQQSSSSISPLLIEELFTSFCESSKQNDGGDEIPIVISNGSVISFPNSEISSSFIINFEGDNSPSSIMHVNSFGCEKNSVVSFDRRIPIPTSPETIFNSAFHNKSPTVGGIEKYLEKVTPMMLSILLSMPLKKEVIKTPIPPLFLISGNIGCGKTTLAKYICRQFEQMAPVYSFNLTIDFKDFGNRDIRSLRNVFQNYLQIAKINQPSIVFMEDFDSVLQISQQGEYSIQSEQLIEYIIDQINICSEDKESIVFIATLKNYTTFHSSMKSTRITNQHIDIKSPNASERLQILESLAESMNYKLHTDVTELLSETEGFVPIDLKQLIERTSHFASGRHYFSSHFSHLDEENVLTADDFKKALENFTPLSLKGIKLLKSETTWEDVGGMEETKLLLKETFEWPSKYANIFAKCPLKLRKGVLLYGPPGCGKTFIASVVAKECGLNFISVKGPEILNKYIGASEQAVRDLFDQASSASPCILFFDEFDAIAPRRGHDNTGVTDRVVNQILTQLDGVETYSSVYVLAATSRPDLIDPALLRPGRLDKAIFCGIPEALDRKKILISILRKLPFSLSDKFLDDLSEETEGFTGADLQALIYNAQLDAVHTVIDQIQYSKSSSDEKYNSAILPLGKRVLSKVEQLSLLKQVDQLSFSSQSIQHFKESHVPVIQESHVQKAMSEFRPSVTPSERMRYEKIYEDFLGSRGAGAVPMSSSGKRVTQA